MKAIIKPFNLVFFITLAFFIALAIVLSIVLKNKDEKTKKIVILCSSIFNVVLWIIYKIVLYIGVEELQETGYTFNIFTELPFHMCNVALFVIIIGVATKNEACMGYCFYFSTVGAAAAFFAPPIGFYDTSIFSLHNIGYYVTHGLIVVNGVLLCTLKLFKPSFKNVFKSTLAMLLLSLAAHGINYLFLAIGQKTDYFYTMCVTEISVLKALWNIIPVRYIYLLPGVVGALALGLVITIPFEIIKKRKALD